MTEEDFTNKFVSSGAGDSSAAIIAWDALTALDLDCDHSSTYKTLYRGVADAERCNECGVDIYKYD
jgi:hypothetical protein